MIGQNQPQAQQNADGMIQSWLQLMNAGDSLFLGEDLAPLFFLHQLKKTSSVSHEAPMLQCDATATELLMSDLSSSDAEVSSWSSSSSNLSLNLEDDEPIQPSSSADRLRHRRRRPRQQHQQKESTSRKRSTATTYPHPPMPHRDIGQRLSNRSDSSSGRGSQRKKLVRHRCFGELIEMQPALLDQARERRAAAERVSVVESRDRLQRSNESLSSSSRRRRRMEASTGN